MPVPPSPPQKQTMSVEEILPDEIDQNARMARIEEIKEIEGSATKKQRRGKQGKKELKEKEKQGMEQPAPQVSSKYQMAQIQIQKEFLALVDRLTDPQKEVTIISLEAYQKLVTVPLSEITFYLPKIDSVASHFKVQVTNSKFCNYLLVNREVAFQKQAIARIFVNQNVEVTTLNFASAVVLLHAQNEHFFAFFTSQQQLHVYNSTTL